MHRKAGIGIIFITASAIFCQSGLSQVPEETLTVPDTIGKVVVTGQFRPQPEDMSIFRIKILDRNDIRMRAANNLGELLRTEPAFQLRSDGILGDFIKIRGLTGEHVKVLIDGIPVTGRVADRIDLSQITLGNTDHIEIIEGPMSVVYGSNALAGAINIITRDNEDELFRVDLDAYFEEDNTWNFSINGSARAGLHSITMNGARDFFSGWGPVDTSRYKTWKPKLQYIAGIGYMFKIPRLTLKLNSDYLNEELRDNGALTLANLYEKALDAHHFTTRWNNRLNLIHTNNDDFVLNLQAGYSYYNKSKLTYLNDLVNLSKNLASNSNLHDTTIFRMVTLRGFVSNIPGKAFEYQAGFDINHESAEGKRTGGNRQLSDISGFVNFIVSPVDNFRIQPGLRIMKHSDLKSPLIYSISIDYKPGPFNVKSTYAKGFRAPSLKQLYLQFIDSNHEIHGNEDLKPEEADNFTLSADYTLFQNRHMFRFGAGLFYNKITDAVQLAISTEQPGWGKYFNVEDYITKGMELSFRYRYSPGIFFNSAVTTTGRSLIGNTDIFHWSTDVTSSAGWSIAGAGLQLALLYKYNDNYLEFAGNYNPQGELQDIVQQSTSGYHIMDFNIMKRLLGDRVAISAGVKNIFNVTQIQSVGNIEIHGTGEDGLSAAYGRIFFINASYNFTKNKAR